MIVTHPDNIELVKNLLERNKKEEEAAGGGFIHTIRSIPVIGNDLIEKERPTGRCIAYWDYSKWWDGTGKPPQWAINFGFIKPEMEPVFYEVNTPRVTVFNPRTSALNWAR